MNEYTTYTEYGSSNASKNRVQKIGEKINLYEAGISRFWELHQTESKKKTQILCE